MHRARLRRSAPRGAAPSMSRRGIALTCGIVAASLSSGGAAGMTAATGDPVADLTATAINGVVNWSDGSWRAYSVGVRPCNAGDVPLAWQASTPAHPVLAQNMYRLAIGPRGHWRFEQIGLSWLKHEFCALSLAGCGDCEPTGCATLGVGCSDESSPAINASQAQLGPRSDVDATTGAFPFPPSSPPFSGATDRRLRVHVDDVRPADFPGASWYIEAQFVTADDAASVSAERAADNGVWRQVALAGDGAATGFVGASRGAQSALHAWAEADAGVLIDRVSTPGLGTFLVGSRAFDNGDGTWDYEYAIVNRDVTRAGGGIDIPVDAAIAVGAFGFHDVAHHSGEPYDDTDWTPERIGGTLRWRPVADHATDPDANALRWGTMYNVRFTADQPPAEGSVTVPLFAPGDGTDEIALAAVVPSGRTACPADLDASGAVDFLDLTTLLANWGPCGACPADLDGDGDVGFGDLIVALGTWGPCPRP